MLTNQDVEADQEISKLIQSAQNDMSVAASLRVEAPAKALTKCEAAINSFKQVLRLFIGEAEHNKVISIKDLLIKSYQLQADIYEQYGMSKAQYCYKEVEKLQKQDLDEYFADYLKGNDYLDDFDVKQALETSIDDTTQEEQLKLPNISMSSLVNRIVSQDIGDLSHIKQRTQKEHDLEQLTKSISSFGLHEVDIDKEPDLIVEQSLLANSEQAQQLSPKQQKPKAKVGSENHLNKSDERSELGKLLNIANEDKVLADWQNKLITAIEIFLNEIKIKVVEGKQLKPRTVLISYYVNYNDQLGVKNMTTLLNYMLQAINMPTDIKLLPNDVEDLKKDIATHKLIIVLCTPAYAQQVERFPEIRQILDDFGKSKKDCLHTLLCDGRFVDTALKVVDKYYLIRDYKLAFVRAEIKDPLTRLLFLIEALFNTSGREGLGVVPDLLNLNQHNDAKEDYKEFFKKLEDVTKKATTEYRLRNHLQENYSLSPVVKYLNPESIPYDINGPEITALLSNFQNNLPAKTMLLIGPREAEVALVNVHLEQLLFQQGKLTLTINCGDYPGKIAHQCVHLALRQLNFKNMDIEELQRQKITIILKNYERIGVYDNLYVKNKLSQWPKVKVIITCRSDFLERRDYKSYFLSDPGDPKLETLDIHEIKSIEVPPELDKLLLSKKDQLSPNAQAKELHHGFMLNTKQQAQHDEFVYCLKEVNKLLVTNNLLKKQISKNPQLFISYAWETGESLVRQQGHLRAIVKHLTTLGIPTWLDVERMTGNIDQQMASNIENSAFVMLIGTPKYAQRAMMETNVKKEYDAILAKTKEHKLKTVPALFTDATYDLCLLPEEPYVYLTPKEPFPKKLASSLTPTIVYEDDNGIACLILKIKDNIQKIAITATEQRDQFKDFIQKNTTNKTVPEQGMKVSLTDQRELWLWLITKGYNPFVDKLPHNSPPTLVYRTDKADKKISFLALKEQQQTITLDTHEQTMFADFIAQFKARTTISDQGLSVVIKDQSSILSWLRSKGYKPFTDKLGNSDPAIIIYADATKITVLQEYKQPKIIAIPDVDQDSNITKFIEQRAKTHPTTVPLKISLSIDNPLISWLTAKGCRPSQFRDLFEHAKSIGHCTIDLRDIDDAEAYIKQLTEILIPNLLNLQANEALYWQYQQQLLQLYKRLAFLPAEHLIVDIGQDLVQAYDIDNRLKIYIKPQIWRYVPVIGSQNLNKAGQNKIYLDNNSDGSIKYTIMNNSNPVNATITKKQLLSLKPAIQDLLAQLEQNFILDNIKPLLPYILQIATTNGHITANDSTPEDQRDLQKSFEAFLAKEVTAAKNYVVLGEAGSGKTLFTLWVFKELLLKEWQGYKRKPIREKLYKGEKISAPKWLPVYIPLKLYSSEKAEECIHKALEVYELDKQDIESLKQGLGTEQGVVFILDGYDELSEASRKDYTSILANWTHSKVLLTSRPEHFNRQSNSEEHYIAPLSDLEKQEFITQYKNVKPDTKLDDASKVFEVLQNMPSLMPLLDNPFLLNLVLQVLPELLKSKTDKDVTRADIYQSFTNLWFTKETIRHTEEPATTEESQRFAELLSFKMRQAKTISVTSGANNDLAKFFDNAKKGARLSCPLQRTGQEYGYIHKSLYEYFLSNSLYLSENNEELAKPIFYAKTLIDEPSVLRFSMELRTPRTIAPKSYHNHRLQLLLNLVGWGEQKAAERMLQLNPRLANCQGDLTDCSGRTFKNITALQYALWALDYHMWTMLLKYMNKEEARAQIARLQRIARLNSKRGWEITGSEVNWPSLVWLPLIKALDEYVKKYDAWDGSQCTNYWCQQVGGAQLILPAHVINEYSHPDRSKGFAMCKAGFWNGKDKDANLPRSGVADWINNSGSKLGSQFAWLREDRAAARAYSLSVKTPWCIDLAAVTELLRSRTEQAQNLVLQLTQSGPPHPRLTLK